MTARITGADIQASFAGITDSWTRRLADQVDTDAAELAALRGDAEEWRALEKLSAHPLGSKPAYVFLDYDGWNVYLATPPDGAKYIWADTPVALLAKLNEIAEAAKPKAEVWRMRLKNGGMSYATFPKARECREYHWLSEELHPVRELRNPRGHVLLLPEGESIPSEGGPWE